MAGVIGAPVRKIVADRFIDDVPAIDDTGVFFLKMGDDLVDIICQARTIGFLGSKRFPFIKILMEKPGILHDGIPYQYVAADADVMRLGPGDHLVRLGIIHNGHAVAGQF